MTSLLLLLLVSGATGGRDAITGSQSHTTVPLAERSALASGLRELEVQGAPFSGVSDLLPWQLGPPPASSSGNGRGWYIDIEGYFVYESFSGRYIRRRGVGIGVFDGIQGYAIQVNRVSRAGGDE